MPPKDTCIYLGQALADYGFKDGHPFGPQRHDVFQAELIRLGLDKQLAIQTPVSASSDRIHLFHTSDYIEKVRDYSVSGHGYLDGGDTPSFVSHYERRVSACVFPDCRITPCSPPCCGWILRV
jgi:acetoin utilization protein AcuC